MTELDKKGTSGLLLKTSLHNCIIRCLKCLRIDRLPHLLRKITNFTTSIAKVKNVPFEKYSTLYSRIRAFNLVEEYIYELKLLKQYMIKRVTKRCFHTN